MKLDPRFFRWPFLALCLLSAVALAACTQTEPADSEPAPTEPPPAAAMSPSMMLDQDVPISDFVSRHAAISEEWDLFHDDFDQWSVSLSSCHPNAMYLALNDFAVSFNTVTKDARSLTRGSTSAELANLLITAAEEEEAALRQLRDHWQPNNVSLFENVEQQRAKSSQAQKSAEDRAIELREGFEDAADPEAVAEFQAALDPVMEDWETLHDDYATLQKDADTLGVDAVIEGLEAHVTGLEAIAQAIEELPELDEAEDTVDALKDALAAEREAFEAALKPPEPQASEATEQADDESETTDESDAGEEDAAAEPEAEASVPDFEPLDAAVATSAESMEAADDTIDDLADPDAERGLAELQVFDAEYPRLLQAWDAFNERYNDWRMDDGGCDRTAVVAELEQYGIRISQLARDVRTLPSSGYLLPIYTVLTEAAARDENAVRTLRYTWQPFTLDSFKAVHQERINTDNLRREAEIAVQELQSRS